ncbi:Lipoteichoic acid synthase 2 [uncultured Flavonifractor sp.]|uniref:LTA synthase family protein n=1 Tax=Flintibacter sp. P01028 TaxID=3342382 RepID=UPI0008226513|nr:Lipoteichoic acid synthase 2 [uncultured Flavonifractor sp.]
MSRPYSGKRIYQERRSSRTGSGSGQTLGRVMFFPLQILYLELVLHIYMGNYLGYLPIYLVFSLAGGLFVAAFTLPFSRLANCIITKVLAFLFSLIYVVEIIAKKILTTYYGFSAVKMAAGNRLIDYADVIVSTLVRSIPIILLLFLPAILIIAFGGRLLGFGRFDIRFSGVVLAGAVIFHLLGLGVVHLPWKGDLTPKQLYRMDTNMDDQVEQLGMLTSLRLDVKHLFFPADNTLDADFSGLGDLGGSSSSEEGGSSQNLEDPEPVIDTSPNVMDVDLSQIAETATNQDIQWLANYFNSVTPTRKNEYTGMFEGYNVIFLTLEGFSGYAIDPELTPTLYKLTHEGFVFNNFYTALHFTSTSGGECQNLLGLYPKNGNPATLPRTGDLGTNLYFSLAQQLGREGYLVQGYHPNSNMYNREKSHPNLGYDWRQFGMGFDNLELSESGKLLWPQRDKYMIQASIDNYLNSEAPFHVYYLTISGHMPYSNNRVANQYRDLVDPLPYSDTTKNYVATVIEVDRALEYLVQRLEEAGKLDSTLIVAAPDHIPYFDVATLEELAGESFGSSEDLEYLKEGNINFDVYRNSLILWSASMEEPVEVDKVCCQVDILPTVSNLLGLEYDSRMLDGSDILSDNEGLVVFSSKCWRSDRGFYDRYTSTFTPAAGVSMTAEEQEDYVSAMKKLVQYKLDSTALVIENDFYGYVFGNG